MMIHNKVIKKRVNTEIIMYLGSWRKLLSCCTLMDDINRGLRDANGSFNKQNVEQIILPRFNVN